MRVDFELTTCGCSQGGIGSVRAYRGGVEIRKEIVGSVRDIVEFIEHVEGDRYLVRIRTRLPDDSFFFLIRCLKDRGADINIPVNKWGIEVP
ncbi:MAG: hypothetical protein GXO59_02810 [Dictyoglomi bacterium]|nr:hypothetical protein [Dictyoglomota bacterium]